MSYSYRIYDSIEKVDWESWDRLRLGESDLVMDRRFILTAQQSLADVGNCRYVLFHDEHQRPAASACLFAYRIDAASLATGRNKTAFQIASRVLPRLRKLKVLTCRLPVAPGESQVRLAPGADRDAVLRVLDSVLRKIAAESGKTFVLASSHDDLLCDLGADVVVIKRLGGETKIIYKIKN